MASKALKGLTIEIAGDTTQLGKALDAVNKKSKDLSNELGEINKQLKFDPGNADLLAQKQKVLADAVSNTKDKLKTLKDAEKQVQEQFERGEVSEEQVRALQREIIATTKKLEGYEKAAEETADAIDKLGKESDDTGDDLDKTEKGAEDAADGMEELEEETEDAGDAADGLGSKLGGLAKGGLKLLTAGVTAAVGALVASAEASREYRTEMGKLTTAFIDAGHGSEVAERTYKELQGVLGETEQAVEAANHLAKLCETEEELAEWTNIATGVYATFGASLPIEGLAEAANETAKTGALTGSLADALNWAGVSEDDFQASLESCNSEQERSALITETLSGLYSDAADTYRKYNGELIRANQANEEWNAAMGMIGGYIEPILTDVKMLGASLLQDLVPSVREVAKGFRAMLNGDEGGAAQMGTALSGIFEHLLGVITNMLPQVTQMAVSLITTLTTSLTNMLPDLIDTGIEIVLSLVSGIVSAFPKLVTAITSALPRVVSSVVSMIPKLLKALQDALPVIVEGVLQAVEAVVTVLSEQLPVLLPIILDTVMALVTLLTEQLPIILPQLLTLVTSLVNLIVAQIPLLIPQIVTLLVQTIQLLAQQLPVLIPQLVTALVTIVNLLIEQLPVIIPMLIEACITVVMALIDALPEILKSLTTALFDLLQSVWDVIAMVFENLPDWFGQLFSGAVDIITGVFGVLGGWFGDIWAEIKNVFTPTEGFFSSTFSGAWSGIKNAWSGVKNFFSNIWSGIKNAFGSVGTWFKDTFTKAWTAVKNVFSTGGKIFDGIKDGIADVFKTTVNAIIKGINKVISVPFNAINNTLDRIKDVSVAGIKPFNWVKTFDIPEIPLLATGGVLKKGQVGVLEGSGAEAVVPLEKNRQWIQRVVDEFMAQVRNEAGADIFDRTRTQTTSATAADSGLFEKLDRILEAIKSGQIMTIDGDTLLGYTNRGLGQERELAARGAK